MLNNLGGGGGGGSTSSSTLSTGIERLDIALLPSLEKGVLSEWAGPPASGKTQLALWLLTTSLIHSSHSVSSSAIFIDSGNGFSWGRIKEFWEGILLLRFPEFVGNWDHVPPNMSLSFLQSHLKVEKAYTKSDLLTILESLHTQTFRRSFGPCHLIIIDSISDILGPLSGIGKGGEQDLGIPHITKLLKSLAIYLSCPIICLNGSVGASTSSNSSSSTPIFSTPGSIRTQTKPALGRGWSLPLLHRIYFTPSRDRQEFQQNLLSGLRVDTENVLAWEGADGRIFPLIECLMECLVKEEQGGGSGTNWKLRDSCQFFVGRYIVTAGS